jgi:serine/threonine protein kinase
MLSGIKREHSYKNNNYNGSTNGETSPVTVTNLYKNNIKQKLNSPLKIKLTKKFKPINKINNTIFRSLNNRIFNSVLNNSNKNVLRKSLSYEGTNLTNQSVVKNLEGNVYYPLLSILNNRINLSNFIINKRNGTFFSGKQSIVYLSLYSKNKNELNFVLKIVKNGSSEIIIKSELYGFAINYMIMKKLDENNRRFFANIYEFGILKIKTDQEKKLYSIMEKCNGDVISYLEELPRRIKTFDLVIIFIRFAFFTLKGMILLHSLGYTHLDIKPDNILYKYTNNNNPEFKLSDFSTLTKIGEEFEEKKGTIGYISPILIIELGEETKTKNKVIYDYYSCGITLFKILLQLFPINLIYGQTYDQPYPTSRVDEINFIRNKKNFYNEYEILKSTIDVVIQNYIEILKNNQLFIENHDIFELFINLLSLIEFLILSNNPLLLNPTNLIKNNINTSNKNINKTKNNETKIINDFYNNLRRLTDVYCESQIKEFIQNCEQLM